LNNGDYSLAAKLYGGDDSLLQTWNPDLSNNLPGLLKRACTQNGLMCLLPRSITYQGLNIEGAYQFNVEFNNTDGSLFHQGPCCRETSGAKVSEFIFRVVKAESGYQAMDLPPYVP
jgi:hypothetical protein